MRRVRASGLGVLAAVVLMLTFAAAAGASTIFFTASSGYDFHHGSIWSVRADGSGARQLRGHLPEGPGGVVASLSRDGKHLFCLCRGTGIDSLKLDGSEMKKVGRRPADTRYDYIVLGPKGEPFWWDDEGRLMTVGRNGNHRHRAVKGYYEEELAIPPRGKRIALSGGTSILTTSLDGGPKARIYHSTFPGLRAVGDMSWSADGKELVFVDYPEPEKYETPADPESHAFLYAGGKVRELPLSQEAMGGPPIFSPDATRLASTGEEGSLFVSGIGGGAPKRILQRNCTPENCLFSTDLLGWVG